MCGSQRGWGIKQDPPPHTHHIYSSALPTSLQCHGAFTHSQGVLERLPRLGAGRGDTATCTHTQSSFPGGGRAGLPPSCKDPRGGSRMARPAHSLDNPHHQMLLGDFSSSRGSLRRLPTLLLVFPARASPFPAPRRGSGQRLLGPLQAPAHPWGSGNPPEDGSGGFPEALCPKSPGLGFVSSSPTILPPD